jgi:aspartyl-tRNA(Asn)/glutamyl-tRNA(Gln) amidotransferase subunit A
MADLDLLVSASQPAEAPRITEVPKWGTMEKPSLTMPFNLTGYPAMTVPTGFGAGGLPVGMQLIAKPFQEPLLFQAAHAFEKSISIRKRRPIPALAEAA